MLLKKILWVIILGLVLQGYAQDKVIYLENDQIKIGILPDVGGRMVFAAPIGEENFLLSDSALWNEPQENRPEVKPNTFFKPYFGFITWVGPQTAWWQKQDLMPNLKQRSAEWPPDPYLVFSNYEVLEHTKTLLVLQGPESPITGVQFNKRYELKGNSIEISVVSKNIRDEQMEWDLWTNARFAYDTEFSVPVSDESQVRSTGRENNFVDAMKYEIKDGKFTFLPEKPSGTKRQRVSKAFIYPDEAVINVVKGQWKLDIKFDKVPKDQIHPEQALIEVYNNTTSNGRDDVLELEHHSAYQTLNAGATMSLSEVWTFEKK